MARPHTFFACPVTGKGTVPYMEEVTVPSYLFGSEEYSESEMDSPVEIEDIDLQALAERVVALLKRELRLENERRGWHRVW